MKCSVCRSEIETTFLKKVVGTVVKDAKGKKHHVCSVCQKKHSSKEEILKKL